MGSLCSRESRYKKQSTLVHSTSHKPNIVQPQPSCQHMSSHIYPAQTITSVTTQIVSMFLLFYSCNYSKVANMDLQFLRFYVFLVTEFIYGKCTHVFSVCRDVWDRRQISTSSSKSILVFCYWQSFATNLANLLSSSHM